jgi:raffinose/stachyose/melibiose transport system permease protein
MYKVLRGSLLSVYAAVILVPCMIVITGAFKTDFEIYTKPLSLPAKWSFANFHKLFVESNIARPFMNSVIVSAFSVFFTLLFASLAAYSISRLMTVTGRVLFLLFSLGLAIPGQVNIIPIFHLFVKLHLNNSLLGLILVNIALTLPISIFILSAFFKDLPKEMFECAGMDGAGQFRIYRSIALPLSKPALGATAIFLFVICWNDLLYPLMLITEAGKKTLPLVLIDYKGEYFASYSMQFSAILVASLPMVVMYLFMQRTFQAGLTAGAVKG